MAPKKKVLKKKVENIVHEDTDPNIWYNLFPKVTGKLAAMSDNTPSVEKHFYAYKANKGPQKGKYVVTVCLAKSLYRVARGVSVCSFDDTPNMNTGKLHAERHALRALKKREKIKPITDERAIRQILNTDCPFTKHLQLYPALTFKEKKLLYGKKMKPQKE
jgi:hypothetical protein